MSNIIQCDNCSNTEDDGDLENCEFCNGDYCNDCMAEHMGEEHCEEVYDKIKKQAQTIRELQEAITKMKDKKKK